MKELSIEEKAKAYDEALEKARLVLQERGNEPDGASMLANLFPELKESEDEKIRKELLNAFQESEESLYMVLTPHKRESFIAWLEKQGELVAEYEDKLDMCACRYFDKGYKEGLEKQREQKSEWSIDEAKCGDILAYPDGTLTIFNYRLNGHDSGLYMSFIVCDSDRLRYNQTCAINGATIATKEQTSELFVKLISQKSVEWSEEDEKYMNALIDKLETLNFYNDSFSIGGYRVDIIANWLKSLKERYTWKPSDEQIRVVARLRHCLLEDIRGNDVVILDNLLEQLKHYGYDRQRTYVNRPHGRRLG